MAIQAALHHSTLYRYDRAISLSPQIIRLRPAPHTRTPIESYSLKVSPGDHFLNWLQDPHGNFLARVVFPEKVREFRVDVDLVADMTVINPFDFFIEETAGDYPFQYDPHLLRELHPFLGTEEDLGEPFAAYLGSVDTTPQKTIDFLVGLNRQLERDIEYLVRMEPGVQTPAQTLERGRGSCRDTAWLLINLLREKGIAARFVSGYLIQLKPDVRSLDGPSGAEEDFTDLHAWAEAFVPGAGWIGLDPTSGLLAGEGHIPLACAPSPLSAAPISGAVENCEVNFDFTMRIDRVKETARVTLPFPEEVWAKIRASGKAIDERMASNGVQLTMGGEPTFISIDDMDGEEWNTAAVGPDKLRLSQALIKRLAAQAGNGPVLHFGQGKWYPGESLPRWAYSCYWREDGEPIWSDPGLLADIEVDYGYTAGTAETFLTRLALRLDVDSGYILPAYEDIWYYLWRERKLPVNVDPLESKLRDPEERSRLSQVFDRGLNVPKGFILPLQCFWQGRARKWRSAPWFIRQKHLFLIPGDSPIGLRLPLEALPWFRSTEPFWQQDPSGHLDPLPTYAEATAHYLQQHRKGEAEGAKPNLKTGEFGPRRQRLASSGETDGPVIRTALTVEARDGKLFIYLPPLSRTEDFLDLVAAIETTSKETRLKVILEGERPPPDPRLKAFKITPDPGVIEVNLQPSASWVELVERTENLYEAARQTRLSAEKFLLDGRHVGTGGGNHIILGGARPEQSPLLQRPDLLRSMLAFWLHHPSLSYLFSGLFIGPTSQSPRIDEARTDVLYELEIAFGAIDAQATTPPWLVDRLFRHLLTDLTGNTHRAEFCIDKLFNPDSSSGRLGLLELRSFEMPPHARMSLVQHLLLRALLCHLWEVPYRPVRLKRWGTELHDRFLLPEFAWQDFEDVVNTLRQSGFDMDVEWFRAQFEFRFPLYGKVSYRDCGLEVRGALEPWHVLGEEGMAEGTVRFVDSSTERIQVKVTNFNDSRYALLCKGCRVPLSPTGRSGEFVSGIRFRAWKPPSCLHPTLEVDAPLTFEMVDLDSGISIGGCTYFVAHPAGRNYETLPVNSYEAEARRRSRFQEWGQTPGGRPSIPPVRRNYDFPLTLDLRLPNQP